MTLDLHRILCTFKIFERFTGQVTLHYANLKESKGMTVGIPEKLCYPSALSSGVSRKGIFITRIVP